jgi:RimJ/RimL family protein N-acetyltransferase
MLDPFSKQSTDILPRNNASKRVAEKLAAKKATSGIFMEEEHDVYCY